jgi:hypothetical protein
LYSFFISVLNTVIQIYCWEFCNVISPAFDILIFIYCRIHNDKAKWWYQFLLCYSACYMYWEEVSAEWRLSRLYWKCWSYRFYVWGHIPFFPFIFSD